MKTSGILILAAAASAHAQSSTAGAMGPAGTLVAQTTMPTASPSPMPMGTPMNTPGASRGSTRTTFLTDSNGRTTGTSVSTQGPGGAATSTQPAAGASLGVAGQWVMGAAGVVGLLAL